jgi:hypothetical protein
LLSKKRWLPSSSADTPIRLYIEPKLARPVFCPFTIFVRLSAVTASPLLPMIFCVTLFFALRKLSLCSAVRLR